jgi:hypothetical protein
MRTVRKEFFGHWYWGNYWVYLLLAGWCYCVASENNLVNYCVASENNLVNCCVALLVCWNHTEPLVASKLIHTLGSLI